CFDAEDVISPCAKVQIQSAVVQFRSISFIDRGSHEVFKDYGTSGELPVGQAEMALALIRSKVHDHQQSIVRQIRPSKANETIRRPVPFPCRARLKQRPRTVANGIKVYASEQMLV